ncbi:MAG: RNA polymerase sigma factor, partial [Planctomycetota bacterium]
MDHVRDSEELLQHAGWLRALAASLVADPATADDLVQETLATAVDRPPRRDSARAWLGKVLRNAAAQHFRSDSRRLHRERAAAKAEALPSAAELATRMELQRQILESVLELQEPYRSTVVLRYYEGLSAAEIARKKGLPAGTVRSHLKRGLDELRNMLDRRHGGRRDTWSAVLLPWIHWKPQMALASASAAASGVLTMST